MQYGISEIFNRRTQNRQEVNNTEIIIKGSPKEIADFVMNTQNNPSAIEVTIDGNAITEAIQKSQTAKTKSEGQDGERKHKYSDFGLSVKLILDMKGKTQNWLIAEIRRRNPGMYVDSSILNKVLTGRVRSGNVVASIKEILDIKQDA